MAMSFSHGALTPDGSRAGCMNRRTNKWLASDRPSHLADLPGFFGPVTIGERRSLKGRRDRQQKPLGFCTK